jgi:hypothetical protein
MRCDFNFGGGSKLMLAAAAPQPNTGFPSLPVRRAVFTRRSRLARHAVSAAREARSQVPPTVSAARNAANLAESTAVKASDAPSPSSHRRSSSAGSTKNSRNARTTSDMTNWLAKASRHRATRAGSTRSESGRASGELRQSTPSDVGAPVCDERAGELASERCPDRHHRRPPAIDGVDDLGAVDATIPGFHAGRAPRRDA